MLSTLEPAADAGTPRGLLRVGGRAIVHHQLGAAIAFGCERVLCLADGLPGELLSLQHVAETGGLSFRVVGNGRDLAQLVAPHDEVLVLADGLLADGGEVARLAEPSPGMLAQPVEQGLAAGFERIDLNHATAGVLRLPGRLMARLADLPGDWNPVSALLRIAAQAELPQRPLPPALPDEGRWTLVRSEAEANAIEPRWLKLHTLGAATRGPGPWLAAHLVERLGPALMHAGTRPLLLTAGAGLLGLFGAGLGSAGYALVGFLLLGASWLIHEAAELLGRIDRGPLAPGPSPFSFEAAFGWLLDGLFVLCCAARLQQGDSLTVIPITAGFAPMTLFGLLRLLPRVFPKRRWAPWFGDRLVAALLLAAASATDVFAAAVMAAALLLIAFALAAGEPQVEHRARLTPP